MKAISVLLVDDDRILLDSLQMLCDWESLGFHITGTAMNGVQALAMYEYVDLFTRQLTKETRRKDRQAVIDLFKQVSLENPRYHDMDQDVVLSYCRAEGFLTQFSLDTDWVKALESVKRIMSNM